MYGRHLHHSPSGRVEPKRGEGSIWPSPAATASDPPARGRVKVMRRELNFELSLNARSPQRDCDAEPDQQADDSESGGQRAVDECQRRSVAAGECLDEAFLQWSAEDDPPHQCADRDLPPLAEQTDQP